MRISDWSSDVCSSDLQRGHGAGGVLDHVAHDRLEAVGDAVELVLQRRGDAHVAADQVAVPADSHADALHVAGTTHRHGPAAADAVEHVVADHRSEEHTSELQSLMRISYAVVCLQKKNIINKHVNPEQLNDDKHTHNND